MAKHGSTTVPTVPRLTVEVATPIPAAEGVDRLPTHVMRGTCWCQPKIGYENPITGDRVYVHRHLADGAV